ncbi:MAG: hypothetical protein LWY06_19530 [Firmicutes bacterium]|nr:hypothetical protein [Bacillota bacterium]
MPERADRLICLLTLPVKFFREVSVDLAESVIMAAGITFVHAVILMFMGLGSLGGLFTLPLKAVLIIAAFSFLVFAVLRMIKPVVRFDTICGLINYAYFIMSVIHLSVYLIIWLPIHFAVILLLIFFGGILFAFYLAVTGITHRFRIAGWKTAASLAAGFIIFLAINLAPHAGYLNILYTKLKGF